MNEQELFNAMSQRGCHRVDSRADKAFASRHFPSYVGEVVFADILFPVGRKRGYRAVLFTDALKRYCDGSILPDCMHSATVSACVGFRLSFMGPPKRIILDSGSNFSGSKWATISNIIGVSIIVVAVDIRHSIGKVERHVQIIQRAYDAISEAVGNEVDHDGILSLTLLAHNMTPNTGCGIAPLTDLNGRPSFLDQLTQATIVER